MLQIRRNPQDSCLELGAGANPLVKPKCQGGIDICVDVRICHDASGRQVTDFVVDFEKPLPIQDGEFSSIVCRYALEHISYPNIPAFLKEVFRVLKQGGQAVFVTPNTEAQLRWVLSNPNGWDGKDLFHSASELLFGTLDYPENSHKAYLDPTIVSKLFSEAGFVHVTTDAYNDRKTDMVITAGKGTTGPASVSDPSVVRQGEAQKVDQAKEALVKQMVESVEGKNSTSIQLKQEPQMSREEMFDHQYFAGGGKVGGYAHEGYRDFLQHEFTFRHLMYRQPKSVLELGSARGPILKRLHDNGITAHGLEISKHCVMTRWTENVHHFDVCRTPWPDRFFENIGDTKFDVSFSCAVLEHIPKEHIHDVLRELGKRCQRHVHAIDFGEHDTGFDKTHCTLVDKNTWKTWFSNAGLTNYEIVDKEDFEKQIGDTETYVKGDGKIKLAVGTHMATMAYYGYTNIDVVDLRGFAQHNGYNFLHHDVRNGLPFSTGVVSCIQASHFLEHLTYQEGLKFLKECRRVLASDGVVRIIVPDASLLLQRFQNSDLAEYDHVNDGCKNSKTNVAKLWSLLHEGHQAAYDYATLAELMKEADLIPHEAGFRRSAVGGLGLNILRETLDTLPCLSLFAEAKSLVG